MIVRWLREDLPRVAAYLLLFLLNDWLVVALYPRMEKSLPALAGLLPKSIGEQFSEALTGGFPGWILMQHGWKGLDLFCSGFAVLLGVGLLARDRETGVLEFHLALPISRARLFWSRWSVASLSFLVPPLLGTAMLFALAPTIGQTLPPAPIWQATALGLAAAFLPFSLCVLLGTLVREQFRVAAWGAGIAALLLLLSLFPDTAPYSPFRWNLPTRLLPLLRGAPFPWGPFTTLAGMSATLTLAAFAVFRRADP